MKVYYINLKPLGYQVIYQVFYKFFPKNRFQRVVQNGQSSDSSPLKAGVPQGSILRSFIHI